MLARAKIVAVAALWGLMSIGSAHAVVDMTGHYAVGILGGLFVPLGICTADVTQTGTSVTISVDCSDGKFLDAVGTVDLGTGEFSISGTCDVSAPPPGTPEAFTGWGTASLDNTFFNLYATCQGIEASYIGSKCGNGLLDDNEECDDGNLEDGDCCSHTCSAETGSVCSAATPACTVALCDNSGTCVPNAAFEPTGTPCDSDADWCATEEVCNGAGTCESTGQSLDCGICATCQPDIGCVASWPEYVGDHPDEPGDCREAKKEKAILAHRFANPERDALKWNWKRSLAFPSSDFGSPTTTTGYTLCIFGAGTVGEPVVLSEVAIPPGAGWAPGPGGFRYRNVLPGVGKIKMDLRSSSQDYKPKIKVKIQGSGLDYPEAMHPSLQWGGITLRADNGKCWASSMGVLKSSRANTAGERIKLKDCFPNFSKCR